MPYIPQLNRTKYNIPADLLSELVSNEYIAHLPAGDINYIVTRILHGVLLSCGTSYNNINSLIGVLECCKLELYRKIAAPYEEEKEEQNGSVIGIH